MKNEPAEPREARVKSQKDYF